MEIIGDEVARVVVAVAAALLIEIVDEVEYAVDLDAGLGDVGAMVPGDHVLALHATLVGQRAALEEVDPADVEAVAVELVADVGVGRRGGGERVAAEGAAER